MRKPMTRKPSALSVAVAIALCLDVGASSVSYAATGRAAADLPSASRSASSPRPAGPGIRTPSGRLTPFTPTVPNPDTATAEELAAGAAAAGFPAGPVTDPLGQAGQPISRADVIARAQSWVAENVPYSQSVYYTDGNGTYRTDCSGFISMAWNLPSSGADNWGATTWTLPDFATRLGSLDELQAGDMIDKTDQHVVLFKQWADAAHSAAVVLELARPGTKARQSTYTRAYLNANDFLPFRYDRILDAPTPPAPPPAAPHGSLWERVRSASGVWQPHARIIDSNRGLTAAAAATLPDDSLHAVTLTGGTVWDRIRSSDGSWQAHARNIDNNGAITAITTTALPDGTLHILTLTNGTVWDRTRSSDGTWQAHARNIDNNGAITAITTTALPDGTLHALTLTNGTVWDRTRSSD
ncbi:hypothetical protein, partial [Saccharothrix sp. ST-888]|uniref:hypothetical protein n=1 Tax=Saccharothrix sp. ST-888 TaxID=1427391 RepID=UPI000B0AA74B